MKKKAYDLDRMEPEPPRVELPFTIEKGTSTVYRLMKGSRVVKNLDSRSLDGAHRESLVFLRTVGTLHD